MQVFTSHKIGEEAKHLDYIIEKEDSSFVIFDMNDEHLANVEDNGDGITIEIADQELVLEYSEGEQLLALLLAHYEGGMKLIETKTVVSI